MSADGDALEPCLQRLCALIEQRLGLRFHKGNVDLLQRGLLRIGAGDPGGITRLHDELSAAPLGGLLWQRLIAEVAVGETYFFRHPEDFAVVSRHVVPALLQAGTTTLRAWSAGCATGEEAYSLAECLSTAAPAASIEVLGTDLNQEALAIAERGEYGPHALRGPMAPAGAALARTADGKYQVPGALRSRVRFAVHNLAESAEPPLPSAWHLIFCRNVLIYFGAVGAAQVLTRLARSLCSGGYLFVSPLDLVHRIPELSPVEIDGAWLFRKAPPRTAITPPPRDSRPIVAPVVATPPLRDSRPIVGSAAGTPPPRDSRPVVVPAADSDPIAAARLAADQGDLRTAEQIARAAVRSSRTPKALHLLALIMGELGQPAEMLQLLEEAVAQSPTYVQGHLSLGLQLSRGDKAPRRAHHLSTVLSLLAAQPDDAVLDGPEPLRVSLARRLAQQALADGGPK